VRGKAPAILADGGTHDVQVRMAGIVVAVNVVRLRAKTNPLHVLGSDEQERFVELAFRRIEVQRHVQGFGGSPAIQGIAVFQAPKLLIHIHWPGRPEVAAGSDALGHPSLHFCSL
jgi:hypothetical protein